MILIDTDDDTDGADNDGDDDTDDDDDDVGDDWYEDRYPKVPCIYNFFSILVKSLSISSPGHTSKPPWGLH